MVLSDTDRRLPCCERKSSMKPAGSERVVFRGDLIEVIHQDFVLSRGTKTFEFARRGPGTRIVLVRADSEILLTREFRRELGRYDTRLPGGKVFDTLVDYERARESGRALGQFASEAAKRELEEETGYCSEHLDLLGISSCGATVEWDLYYFLCTNWQAPPEAFSSQEDEDVRVEWTPFSRALQMCLDGNISEERSAVHILRYIYSKHGLSIFGHPNP